LPKSGRESGGVARPWCGRLGQGDHCPGAISLGDVSRQGHPLVALRRSRPQAWTQAKARRDTAGVPTARSGARPRHPLALARLATKGAALPHGGMAGDDERGRPYGWRQRLAAGGERDRLAVPSPPLGRALENPLPPASGLGRRPQRPWHSGAVWRPGLAAEAWPRGDGRAGSTGPLGGEVVNRRGVSRPPRRPPGAEALVGVIRSRDRDHPQGVQVDDALATAAPETPQGALARVAPAAQRIAAGRQRSKRDAGWADEAGRHGTGWQQQHTLALLATWLRERETQRRKKHGRLPSPSRRSVKAWR
jgi:DDE superfamily endonuclease